MTMIISPGGDCRCGSQSVQTVLDADISESTAAKHVSKSSLAAGAPGLQPLQLQLGWSGRELQEDVVVLYVGRKAEPTCRQIWGHIAV